MENKETLEMDTATQIAENYTIIEIRHAFLAWCATAKRADLNPAQVKECEMMRRILKMAHKIARES